MALARRIALLLLLYAHALHAQEAVKPVRVLGISVTGNRITKERIIVREVLVQEGDTVPASVLYDKLERSRQNLMNTGLFNTVVVLPVYTDSESAFVEVNVNERWTIWPAPIFQLADPNFNTWWYKEERDLARVNYGAYLYKYNFRGRNETVYVKAQFGYTRQFGLRYKVPYIDAKQRWGLSIGGSYIEQAEVTAGTIDNRRLLVRNPNGRNRDEQKADLELSLRRSHDVRHFWRLGFTQAAVRDTIVQRSADYFDGRDATDTRFLSLGYTLIWDQRDMRIYPRQGRYAELRIDQLGLGALSTNAPNVTTAYATLKKWWKLSDRATYALGLRGKHTWGTPPYYVQEGLGYVHSVRGYEYYVVDGESFVLGKSNFIYQIYAPRTRRVEAMPVEAFRTLYLAVYADLFVDAGRVWDSRYAERNFLANSWLSGYGVGLNVVTSYDQVVRGEYTLNALGEHGFFLHFTQPF